MRSPKTIGVLSLLLATICFAQEPYHNSLVWRAQQWVSSGVVAPIIPTNVTSGVIQLWCKSDYGVFKTGGVPANDGDRVAVWTNMPTVTNRFCYLNYGVASRQPTNVLNVLNGFPAIRFGDKASNVMVLGTVTTQPSAWNQPLTAIMVFQPRDLRGYFNSGIAANESWDHYYSAGNYTVTRGVKTVTVGPISSNQWYYVTTVYDGASSKVWTNGNLAVTGDLGTSTMSSYRIGADSAAANASWVEVVEVIIYKGAISDSDRLGVDAYIRDRYGFSPP